MAQQTSQDYFVYVGTYTHSDSEGIYVYRLDGATGALEYSSKASGVEHPSFVEIHPNGKYLYAVNELNEYDGKASGSVTAFYIHQDTGELSFLNKRATGGGAPCHLSVDANRQVPASGELRRRQRRGLSDWFRWQTRRGIGFRPASRF